MRPTRVRRGLRRTPLAPRCGGRWPGRPGIPFDVQVAYGVRPDLHLRTARRGDLPRVATPFEPDRCLYLVRRLAERSASVLFLARDLARP